MLTFPSAYNTALGNPFRENWIVRLYSTNSNFIGIAFDNITMQTGDTATYHGCILNSPSIRDSIMLESGKTKSSNLTINASNISISSTELSKTLYTGTYINNEVKIFSVLNGDTNIANAVQIYNGRLTGISLSEKGTVKISVVAHRPWSGIDLPNTLSDNNIYTPVAYGDYSRTTGASVVAKDGAYKLYPIPYLESSNNYLYYSNATSASEGVSTFCSYYDSGADAFPWLTLKQSSSETRQGVNAIGVSDSITRTYRLKPNTPTSATWTNDGNALDNDNSTYTEKILNVTNNQSNSQATWSSTDSTIDYQLPVISGKLVTCALYVYASVNQDISADGGESIITDRSFTGVSNATNNTIASITGQQDGTDTTSGSSDIAGNGNTWKYINWSTNIGHNGGKLPPSLKLHLYCESNSTADGTSGQTTTTAKIYDIWMEIKVEEDYTNEPNSAGKEVRDLKVIYSGVDGLTKSWSSGLADKAEEAHRDILHRFLGITTTPNNFSTLTSEKNCNVRTYTQPNKTTTIREFLDKLAYEGGFCFRFGADGTPTYHYIENSPSTDASINHSHIKNLQVSHTDFNNVVTDWTIQSDKNPAGSKYYTKTTHTDSSQRSTYNFGSNENKLDIKLNHVIDNIAKTGGNRNDSFLNYYTDLLGTVKQLVSFELVNPQKSKIEVGDVITFQMMSTDKLDGSWNVINDKFIITDTVRSVGGKMKIRAREI